MGIQSIYRFNSNVNDPIGGLNLTNINGTYKSGVANNALEFGSSNNQYAYNTTANNFTTQDFTFSFMYYAFSWTTSDASNGPVMLYKGQWGVNGYYVIIPKTGGGMTFTTSQSGSAQYTSAQGLKLNIWQHIVFTRNGSSVIIYIDGVNRNTDAGIHSNPTTSSEYFMLNRYNYADAGYIMGNVKYDEFKVEQRKWIASEVKNQYSFYKGFF